MMTQTAALFLDAYRELNAKKMFWTVLVLNVLAIAFFATLGVKDDAMTFLWYQPFGRMIGLLEYKLFFSTFVVGFWFTWAATVLALISTAGIFPDLMSSGSIDLYLSKPISRLRLFFTKFLTGLLFVTLQVTVFATLSFIVLGTRAGIWEPGIFWAIPLVVLFFSYLFGICVLLGVLTRSTIAALFLTLLVWTGIFIVDFVDRQAGTISYLTALNHDALERQAAQWEARVASLPPTQDPETLRQQQEMIAYRDQLVRERDNSIPSEGLERARTIIFYFKSFVPKTRETMALLDRTLFKDADLKAASASSTNTEAELPAMPPANARGRGRGGPPFRGEQMQTAQIVLDKQRSTFWIIGTSLLFEAAVLALAAWRFCTRDY